MSRVAYIYCLLALATLLFTASGRVFRPRGVSILRAPFYEEGKPFTCFDGSQTIDFERINDDYCDCKDSSDEPGTSACPNGSFHCTNVGHVFLDIPSSRINDGVCDCCDGTDEFDSSIQCVNNCQEMGAAARVEYQKKVKTMEEGHKIFQEYIERGSKARVELQEEQEKLSLEVTQLEENKKELEALKDEAESPEKEAKTKHEELWKAEKEKRQQERDSLGAAEAFKILDKDGDDLITQAEMQMHMEFDIDADQVVSEEEAREYLEDLDNVAQDFFTTNVWPNIKSVFNKDKEKPEEPAEEVEGEEEEEDIGIGERADEFDDEEGYEDDDDDFEDDDGEEEEEVKDDEMPDYDEETKNLMKVADAARENFKNADDRFKEADRKLKDVRKVLDLDLGPQFQFYPLKGQCYEFKDREYVYNLCPYDRATQKSKSGGAETSLGQWSRWDGPVDDKYSIMLFENGQSCWNGPNRSVRVHLECGTENELLGAEEPNRCVYSFHFKTPAVCSSTAPPHPSDHYPYPDEHTEL